MSNEQVYVAEAVRRGLLETAEAAGSLNLAQVIGAAVWAFARQDESLQDFVVLEYGLQGSGQGVTTKTRKTLKERFHELVCHLCAPFRRRAAR